jgi:hypothetical protein
MSIGRALPAKMTLDAVPARTGRLIEDMLRR